MRALLLLLLLAGCAGEAPDTLTVLAASSLAEAFTDLEAGFEAAHPEVEVQLAFAGSQALATQVRHGIRADVFASADERQLAALVAEGLAEQPRAFAGNRLVLALAEQDARALDLERLPGVGSLVLGDDEVPAGRYARALLDAAEARYGEDWRAAVESRVVSREPNVRLALAKVAMGEAEAALVYATDVAAVGGLRAVELPEGPEVAYHQARLATAPEPELAARWLDHVSSEEGRRALAARGFEVGGP